MLIGIKCCPPECPDRRPACQDTCPRYAEHKAKHDKIKEAEQKEKDKNYTYESYIIKMQDKARRHSR